MSADSNARARRGLRRLGAGMAVVSALALVPVAVQADDDSGTVVVANRGSGDVSVIDTGTLAVDTVDLPGDAEPMYVSHDRRHGRVLVGDRASSTVVALDDETLDVVGAADVGDGVFHQWIDPSLGQLWVVGDASQTVSVVDTETLGTIATITIPADIVAEGGRPHDVFVDGRHAFVSILGLSDGSGVVLRYSTSGFAETGRIVTGADPHLFVRGSSLFVAAQGASTVERYQVSTLQSRGAIDVPSAHGIFVSDRGEVLVTNIAGGGVDAVFELGRRLSEVVDTADTSAPVPHNLTVADRRQVFVTHSGATADLVSVIDLDQQGFGGQQLVTVGTNPFGLAFVP